MADSTVNAVAEHVAVAVAKDVAVAKVDAKAKVAKDVAVAKVDAKAVVARVLRRRRGRQGQRCG